MRKFTLGLLGNVIAICLALLIPATGLVSRESIGGRCEWILLFKAASGNGRDVFDMFVNGGNMNVDVKAAMNLSSNLVYRDHRVLDKWRGLDIEQVMLKVYSKGDIGTWFLFDGLGSTLDGWFSQRRLIASPYPDLKTGAFNFFQLSGDVANNRQFLINRHYGATCAEDCGYFFVSKNDSSQTCDYDSKCAAPMFIYAKMDDPCVAFESEECAFCGDRLVISAKVCNMDLWID